MGRIVGRKRSTLKGKQQAQSGTTEDATAQQTETVHRRNVHLFAQPVILAFHIIRFVAFQLWLLLSLVCRVGSNVLATRTSPTTEASQTAEQEQAETRRTSSSSTSSVVEMTRPGPGSPGRAAAAPSPNTGPGGVGYALRPGAPVLAQQKHHHRKAFEYISKALKLDEDGKGSTAFCLL